MLNFHDNAQGTEKQQQNNYFGEQSFLSGGNTIPSHTSEAFSHVEVSAIPEGVRVGGDA